MYDVTFSCKIFFDIASSDVEKVNFYMGILIHYSFESDAQKALRNEQQAKYIML